MHILVVNPNSTAAMTSSIEQAARMAASDGTRISAVNPIGGPASIQGAADGVAALPGLYSVFDREVHERGGYDAAIIACFDDTGLHALRERSPIPVTGIGEAAYLSASKIGQFSVITTLAVSIPVLEENIALYSIKDKCVRVRASGIPVLELEDRMVTESVLKGEIRSAILQDRCDAIVLGCAGMTAFAQDMESHFGLPVIEGISAAVSWCEMKVLE